jgi:hypothetical protein
MKQAAAVVIAVAFVANASTSVSAFQASQHIIQSQCRPTNADHNHHRRRHLHTNVDSTTTMTSTTSALHAFRLKEGETQNMFEGPLPLVRERDACGVGFIANVNSGGELLHYLCAFLCVWIEPG